ncbi:MAG: winged helix-turn-helix domain-containing protein [Chloroflexi bacterium]|nr:winged helix-turn-helix domain-containing protein [Chloroflexota bacterium]
MAKILVVEDDRSLSDALVYNLRREEHTPLVAADAPSAVEFARGEKPDLVLLDLMLPSGSGFEVCRSIRSFSAVPIIMLTARGEDIDRVLGLEIGADDYVTKPFHLRELLARIKANLRRVELDRDAGEDAVLAQGELTIDTQARRVDVGSQPVALQPKEFDLLVYFMRFPGTVLTRKHLLHAVWGHEFVGERTVDVHVRRVRAKLERANLPDVIRTVHGVGYAFDASLPGADRLLGQASS